MEIKRKTVTIRQPFYGAGSDKMYGWSKDGYDIWGIGIESSIFENYDSLNIIIGENTYRVSTDKAYDFVQKYNSWYKPKNYNLRIGVFSKSLLRKVN